jgi:hypothetical protein
MDTTRFQMQKKQMTTMTTMTFKEFLGQLKAH